jgi:hypothetical protein
MKIPEIKKPEDWYEVEPIMAKLMVNLPEFRYQYTKLVKNVDNDIRELAKIEIDLRRLPKSIEYNRQKRYKLKEINDMIKMFSKMHLLASLAKR